MQLSEKISIPREQVIAGLELAKAAQNEVRTSIRSLYECLQVGSAAIENEEISLTNSGNAPFVNSRTPRIEAELISCLRVNAARLYNASAHAIRYTPEADWTGERFGKELLEGRLVEAHLESDGIYIRLPMLGSRNARLTNQRIQQADRNIFRNEIVYAIEHDDRFQSYDFSRFDHKIIQFLYVYNLDPRSHSHRIIDNDNHETKAIQDAVALFLPGGDCGLTCANFSASTLSNEIPEGTYITVAAAKNGVKPSDEIIKRWVELLAKTVP